MEHSAAVLGALDELVMADPHVVGYSGDEADDRGGICVYVDEPGVSVPDEVAGRPVTEIIAVGRPQNHTGVSVGVDPKTRIRPLLGGISISGAGSGTLGYFVDISGARALISCSHVLKAGTSHVIQPSSIDGGKDPQDLVATLTASIIAPDDGVDAAAAKLESGIGATLELNGLWKVTGLGTPHPGDTVMKSGKNSGVTTGTVFKTNETAQFPDGLFKHMISVKPGSKPFSVPGDSGALVVLDDRTAIGVNKGGDIYAFACPIDAVLAKLNATLAT